MTALVARLRNIAAAKSRPMDRASCVETEAADALERYEDLARAVLYYADNPMTGTSLQIICADIRRALATHGPHVPDDCATYDIGDAESSRPSSSDTSK